MAREKENKGVKSYANQSKAKTNFNKPPAEKKKAAPAAKKKTAPKPRPKPESVKAKGYTRKGDNAGGPRKSTKMKPQSRDGDGSLGQGRSSPAAQKRKRQAGYGKNKGPLEVTVRRKDAKGYRSKTAR